MKKKEGGKWRGEGGQYLGDISALCFLHLPPHIAIHSSSLPFLLAGTGSHILLFDITLQRQIRSFHVFEGVRVHGIASILVKYEENPLSSSVTFRIVVTGEKRVKLYSLCLQFQSKYPDLPNVSADFILFQLLPRFSHWVLDVCFLQDSLSSSERGGHHLAAGCCDNSVHIWDILTSTLMFEVRCPERCLLYSMRLWGNKIDALHIASGTIFNEVVVWKLAHKRRAMSAKSTAEDSNNINGFDDIDFSDCHNYQADIVSRLAGHQGSIFCLSWSHDRSKLVSVSDDRSARMWISDSKVNSTDTSGKSLGTYSAGPMLFGHGARVWDCCISESLIVTVGEDCTCRVWGLDGRELAVFKEHMGRGIWRCLYDPLSSLLVTGGFDSAIKVRCLPAASVGLFSESVKEMTETREEVLKVGIPNLSALTALMDSKSEYVRCLKYSREDSIYVATNHGYVYHAKLLDSGSVEWTELVRAAEEVPIICMDLLSITLSKNPIQVEDWIAVGDGKGVMKVIRIVCTDCTPTVAIKVSWSAEMERQLLGTYWCKSIGCRFIFTSNPRGVVKLWRWSDDLAQNGVKDCDMYLVAEFISPFGARIMCLDASLDNEVLICGDLRGNLVVFPLLKSILPETSQSIEKTSSLVHFKGAHGISTVSSISMSAFSSTSVEIYSTGADGCVCYLELDRDQRTLEFVGMKQIKELSLVQSVFSDHDSTENSGNIRYAVGFSSTDFLIWNLLTETKLLQVKCGGWRRPHSYYLGCKPEISSSFAYVKDEIIYVHRYRAPHGEKNHFPCNLHLQFHGREIHTLCFISEESKSAGDSACSLLQRSVWIATGCEDGTVRLTRFRPGEECWSSSNLLGEHVGGSAVRSLCFVSKVHSAKTKVADASGGLSRKSILLENENPCLLISVGAKRVLTSWLLRSTVTMSRVASSVGPQSKYEGSKSLQGDDHSMSFKWLSTDMPMKCVRPPKKTQETENFETPLDRISGAKSMSRCTKMPLKQHGVALDDDWRYLAVTAFLVSAPESRSTVCFIVVASSDASLTLRALVLPYRFWFDVACLAPLSSPALALQHVVIPLHIPYQGNMVTKNLYILISGLTDGSIIFWDLSEHVEAFMLRMSSLHVNKSIGVQKRPRTGRGSQGGRWWRSINTAVTAKSVATTSMALNDAIISNDYNDTDKQPNILSLEDIKVSSDPIRTAYVESQELSNDSSLKIPEIEPLHILSNVHQSGVNSLHLCSQSSGNSLQYCVVSGGDDQALNLLQFILLPATQTNSEYIHEGNVVSELGSIEQSLRCNPDKIYSIKFLHQNKVISAHSSAVKGVWTDGIWVFSTGLDQRVRCWKVENYGNMTEHGHFITSVPEPEALDVTACGSACYQVAVAGRGMQMVEFYASCESCESD